MADQREAPGVAAGGRSRGGHAGLELDVRVALSYRWPALGRLVKARPKPLIEDGRPNRRVLRREFMSADELASLLRLQGIHDISVVKRAQIEPNGMISVERRDGGVAESPHPPPTMG